MTGFIDLIFVLAAVYLGLFSGVIVGMRYEFDKLKKHGRLKA